MIAERHSGNRAKVILHAGRILLALALLAFVFFRFVDPRGFVESIRHLDARFIPLTVVSYLVWRFASTWQMTYLLRCRGLIIPFRRAFRVQTIAILFSTALPSDFAGAAATWYMLSKDTNKRAVIANALVHLRLLGLIVVAAFACLGFIVDHRMASLRGAHLVAGLAAVAFICLSLTLFTSGLKLVERICITFLSAIPKRMWAARLREALAAFFSEARSVRRLPLTGHLILWSATIFVNLAAAVIVFVSMRAATILLPFTVSIWLVALIAVIQIIPLTPGGLGVREVSIIAVLKSAYGIMPEKALAFATLILLLNLIFGVGLGGYWFLFPAKQSQ